MDVMDKFNILSMAAKYDVSCASSGVERAGKVGSIGSTFKGGICHSFSADGRCISLLKILHTNDCIYDCKYCGNRRSANVERATFTSREVADLTINFYKRNYIEGLFLSSGVYKSPDITMEMLCETVRILRYEYNFNGYIHVKAIPGADPVLIEKAGRLVDRMSVNIELPTAESLMLLAPQKKKESIFTPMRYICGRIDEDKRLGSGKNEIDSVRPQSFGTGSEKARVFVPGGQSTQMIVGATPDSDLTIIKLTEKLYNKMELKRVYYSAYVPVNQDPLLPAPATPPLLREHRLYQADWLLRFYNFRADEILDKSSPFLDLRFDPKCNWALKNLQYFPVEVNKASQDMLVRVPGIGVQSAKRIIQARRLAYLDFDGLKKIGVVLKRARFFITCKGKAMGKLDLDPNFIIANLTADPRSVPKFTENYYSPSLFDYSGIEDPADADIIRQIINMDSIKSEESTDKAKLDNTSLITDSAESFAGV
ncbi:MAG: putative DNA modification/repair radical SAM protein [Clostridiales bacterium]|nr:putative DNA modification/repair radical SAM protein [Clostridiales bacterium]